MKHTTYIRTIILAAVVAVAVAGIAACKANDNTEQATIVLPTTVATEEAATEVPTEEVTEESTAEPIETEASTTEPLSIEGISDEPTDHDTPDISGMEYPFNSMSFDWDEDTLRGWRHYDLPTEFVQSGGYLPDAVQVYAYALCNESGLDYSMVLAVIEIESGYKYDAVSSSGALGYMQIVARYHSNRLGEQLSDEDLLNPYINLEVGIDYLNELSARFGSQEEVLTAYHYGVSGAYRNYWNNGDVGSPYSDRVLEIASRIRAAHSRRALCGLTPPRGPGSNP